MITIATSAAGAIEAWTPTTGRVAADPASRDRGKPGGNEDRLAHASQRLATVTDSNEVIVPCSES